MRSCARLRASEAAVREYERLEAALAALSGEPLRPRPVVPRRRGRARLENAPRHRRPRSRSKRAPRGANRAAALRAIGEHPGAGVADLVAATGISRGVLYALLGRLTEQGEIRKQALPGDATGYVLAGAPASETSTAEPDAPGRGAGERRGCGARSRLPGTALQTHPGPSTVSTPQPAAR